MIPDDKRRHLFGVQGHQLTKTADPIEEPLDRSSCKADRIRSQVESVASLLIQCWIESAPNELSSGRLICTPCKREIASDLLQWSSRIWRRIPLNSLTSAPNLPIPLCGQVVGSDQWTHHVAPAKLKQRTGTKARGQQNEMDYQLRSKLAFLISSDCASLYA